MFSLWECFLLLCGIHVVIPIYPPHSQFRALYIYAHASKTSAKIMRWNNIRYYLYICFTPKKKKKNWYLVIYNIDSISISQIENSTYFSQGGSSSSKNNFCALVTRLFEHCEKKARCLHKWPLYLSLSHSANPTTQLPYFSSVFFFLSIEKNTQFLRQRVKTNCLDVTSSWQKKICSLPFCKKKRLMPHEYVIVYLLEGMIIIFFSFCILYLFIETICFWSSKRRERKKTDRRWWQALWCCWRQRKKKKVIRTHWGICCVVAWGKVAPRSSCLVWQLLRTAGCNTQPYQLFIKRIRESSDKRILYIWDFNC